MATDLKTLAQAAFAAMIVAQPNCVVTVVANGNTAQALRNSKVSEPHLTENGETGVTTSTVFCNADTIGTISKGQSMTVAGLAVFALRCKIDPCGAIATIYYSEQRPVVFSADNIQ
jgi:hypothetical protein